MSKIARILCENDVIENLAPTCTDYEFELETICFRFSPEISLRGIQMILNQNNLCPAPSVGIDHATTNPEKFTNSVCSVKKNFLFENNLTN